MISCARGKVRYTKLDVYTSSLCIDGGRRTQRWTDQRISAGHLSKGDSMKRLAIVLLIVLIPATFLTAEISIGSSNLYWGDVTQLAQGAGPDMSNLMYGLETRAKLWIFRADAAAYYSGVYDGSMELFVPIDVGLSMDLLIVRVGVLAGYNYWCYFSDSGIEFYQSSKLPYNVKGTVDILLGKGLSLGFEGYYRLSDDDVSGLLDGSKEALDVFTLSNLKAAACVNLRF